MAQIQKGFEYFDGMQVTAANLNGSVDNAILLRGSISEQPDGSALYTDRAVLADASSLKNVTVENLLQSCVKLNGADAMTGELILSSTTATANRAATPKAYVDGAITTAINGLNATTFVLRDGSRAMSGDLTLVNSTPAAALSAASKGYVDGRTAFTPVQQGGGAGQLGNKVYIGWGGSDLRLQVDSTDFTNLWPIGISGNSATATLAVNATNAAACSGNSVTATTATNALACSGNSATATTATNALSCSGNSATATLATTATTATNALACSGNSATATLATNATTAATATNALACSGNSATSTLANNVVSGGNGVPAGAVMAWPSATLPAGWLECNGQSTSGYTALAAVVGANVPDLRGQFVRGWDHGAGTDSGRSLKSSQSPYAGTNDYTCGKDDGDGQTGPRGEVNAFGVNGIWVTTATDRSGVWTSTIATNAGDTRPTNIALMYIIKT